VDLPIPPLGERHFDPGVVLGHPQDVHVRALRWAIVELYATSKPLQDVEGELPADLGVVRLGHRLARVEQRLGQVPIVGQQQGPVGVVVQPPHGIDPLEDAVRAPQQVADGRSTLGIAHGGHHAAGLV
jgi:hypothetical protein